MIECEHDWYEQPPNELIVGGVYCRKCGKQLLLEASSCLEEWLKRVALLGDVVQDRHWMCVNCNAVWISLLKETYLTRGPMDAFLAAHPCLRGGN